MKTFNIVFCILFLISAALQYNDVDPLLWIVLYGYGAWACYMAARGRYLVRAYALGIVVYLGFVVYYLIFKHGVLDWLQNHEAKDLVQSMKADKPWIEETREVLGLLILIAVLAVDWVVAVKRKRVA
ncbi:transmembrane 220 family protein [Parapedobacter soli]|uniref:transmembrane 220 family protein n=1 Tax=Parapedobacter soli TaxID=416955 RepID=UPI0021C89D84|nr:transmembrane 220 family protein [Parapedobacter soli]